MKMKDLQKLAGNDLFKAVVLAHQSFGSLLPGLEELGSRIRAAIEKTKLNPDYSAVSDHEWNGIGIDLSDSRYYYVAGCGHIAPSLEELEKCVRESADSLLP